MRKIFLLFVALLATTALWAYDFVVDDIYYNYLDGNNVTVTYKGIFPFSSAYSGEVTIPETVTYDGTTYSVTSIGGLAFYDCSSLTSVTIPNSVTSIGESAFWNCSSLTSITIPISVTSIGDNAFSSCSSLSLVTLTAPSVEAFCNGQGNNLLRNAGCHASRKIAINGEIITSITIPNSVTSIGNYAFEYCSSLTSVTIPNSVTSIGGQAFAVCSSLTSITIPNSVTSIGDSAFYSCSSLTSVTIPNSVTSVGNYAFYNCSSLSSITIPNSVTSIGDWAFQNCSPLSLVTLTAPSVEAFCNGQGNNLLRNAGCHASRKIAINGEIITSITIPNSVTSIGDGAFRGCSSLTSITIPNSVTSIGDYAFDGCSSLTSIKIEATTPPTLGSSVFESCESLSTIYIPNNTLSAYQQVWGAKYTYINNETILSLHVEVPGTLSDLIFDAGTRPINVIKLTLTGTLNDDDFTCMRETMTSLVDVDLSGITNTSGVNFKNKTNLMRIILPADLATIGSSAFSDCSSLTSVTIPNSVTSIGTQAFYNCSSLSSITIPNSVTSIGDYAFCACYALTSVTIPSSVMSIGYSVFRYCTSLTSVTIGNSVTSIGGFAFSDCSSLTSVTIPNSVTSIGAGAFYNCTSLTSVIIPNSVTSIGDYAFCKCSSLTSITIPNSVTSIGEDAFSNCSKLTSITIGNSVTSIGASAFSSCSSLTSITCLGTTPPNASNLGAPTSTCTLTVPHSAYNAYLRHTYWGQFLNINTGYLVILQANNNQWGEVTSAGIYTQEATITATPNEGYTFLRWSDGNTDNPRTIQVISDTTLTAEFAIEGGRLVTFVDWDGTVLSYVSVASGEAATAPADPTREGYTFIGWDKDFSAVTDHMTVTAQYLINRYHVRFFDDDTLLKTDSVEYQSAAVAPANPYHEGYTFTGWDQAFDSITSDLDVYAMYEMGEDREMTIVFTNSEDNDSEIHSQTITIQVPAAPEIAGFTFLYWQPVAEPITNVITIQAIYEADIPTSAPEEYINPANPAQKLLRNGQVYILQDGKTYTIMGAEIQ